MADLETRNLTILLTDIKGFTDKTSRKSRVDINEMLSKHKEIVLPVLEGRGGRLIKTIGDAFLMVFESPTDAVLAGVAVQGALAEYNADKTGDDRIEIRIAINLGEVNLADNDIFGEAVNITARIEGVAEAGEVFFTEAVYLAMNKNEVPSSEIGLLQLKGIPDKIRVYKVRRERPVEGAAQPAPGARWHVWDLLRAKLPPPVSGPKAQAGAKPPFGRRAAALLIDLAACFLLSSMIFGRSPGADIDIAGDKDGRAGSVHVGEDGVRLEGRGSSVSIGDSGVDVRPAAGSANATAGPRVSVKPRRSFKLFPLLWFLYGFVFLRRWGATPGKRVLKLAVVSVDGRPLDKGQALARPLFSLLSGYALGIGYLWGVFEKDGRCWHDLLSGTKVVAL